MKALQTEKHAFMFLGNGRHTAVVTKLGGTGDSLDISSKLVGLYGSGIGGYSNCSPLLASDFPGILRPLLCL